MEHRAAAIVRYSRVSKFMSIDIQDIYLLIFTSFNTVVLNSCDRF
jgi:hypothetical protein